MAAKEDASVAGVGAGIFGVGMSWDAAEVGLVAQKGLSAASDVARLGRGSQVERVGEMWGEKEVCGMTGRVQTRFNIARTMWNEGRGGSSRTRSR